LNYSDFLATPSLSKLQLLSLTQGVLIKDPPSPEMPKLPAPPFLMFDRVVEIKRDRPMRIVAEQDVLQDAWYFQCHFKGDPVQPGCLGLDAVWQLLGLYLFLNGGTGSGRALGVGEVEFFGQIRPFDKIVRYDINVRRLLKTEGSSIVIGDATVLVDEEAIYTVKNARVGCFANMAYTDYPNPESTHARGGVIDKSSRLKKD
jgi:3-hydroxyacyl-[acyl-carrier protein] dehydratase/trans-2-decenoyl-[acyl-carrier protein] isomerase